MTFVRWLLLPFVLLSAAPVYAQTTVQGAAESTSDDDPAGYRQLVADALAEYELGHFEESRALMSRAHALFPNARTLRGLGMVSFELRNYPECVRQLEQALASQVRPLTGALREDTQALLERARSFVGALSLQVTPASARVWLDGVQREPGVIVLSVGEHTVEARAEGFISERRSVRVASREQEVLRVDLARLNPATTAQPVAEPARRWYKSPWLWGVTGALVAGGVATGLGLALRPDEPQVAAPYRGLSGEPPLSGPSQ